MPSDDPIAALRALDASDERQASPLSGLTRDFLKIVKLWAKVCVPPAAVAVEGVEAAAEWLSRWRQTNRNELIEVMADELQRHEARIKWLVASSAKHSQFMQEEMPGLILDALRRAEQVRDKERIARLARILVHAAEVGPHDGADCAEEMMRVAMDLTERDLIVLREMKNRHPLKVTGPFPEQRYLPLNAAIGFRETDWRQLGFSLHELESICCKLQSFGLVVRMDDELKRHGPNGDPQRNAYELLRKGWDFVEYIRGAAETEPAIPSARPIKV
jgi:hypothetical protein